MGPLRDLHDVPHRPLGGEDRIGGRRRNGTRRPRDTKNRYRGEDEEAEGDTDSFEHRQKIPREVNLLSS
jgi:hypothetical protein